MTERTPVGNQRVFQILSAIIVVISFIVGVLAYPHLPDQVPNHWNAAGEIDGYTNRFQGAFMLPLTLLGMFILFLVIPKIDPKRANFAKMGRVYWTVSFAFMLFMGVLYLGTLGVALGYIEELPSLIYIGIGALFIILGNYMGKVKHNYMFGIRTPWTLASEEVWHKTHRFSGPLWVIGGILFFFVGFLPAKWTMYWFMGIIIVIGLVPTVYSYLLFNKLKKENGVQ